MQEYLDLLNGRVFFWLSRGRLDALLDAYRGSAQLVRCFDTAEVLERHGPRVQLSPFNSGSMKGPRVPVRGRDVFRDVGDFPYEHWRRKHRSRGAVVAELTVEHAVPDAAQLAVRVERWQDGQRTAILH
ncbi:hypothetical protein ACEZCY_02600 [Streptacidiphilus sp. N1-12]|uniref:Uncharacterized protein n=2 Tax=Streptacidiphilus alkalitolerans TaxID=3342712 RepID=A0ABV6W7T5_9ACTN